MKQKSVASENQDHERFWKQIIISPAQFHCERDSVGLLTNRVDAKTYQRPAGNQERSREVGEWAGRRWDF